MLGFKTSLKIIIKPFDNLINEKYPVIITGITIKLAFSVFTVPLYHTYSLVY